MTMDKQVREYKEDLQLLPDKDSKMEYILDYAKEGHALDEMYKSDDNIVKRCPSLAWLHKELKDGKIILEAEGDSIIAKGVLVMLLGIFNNRTPEEILNFDIKKVLDMGVTELLSPVRQQGFEAFLNLIYTYANQCKGQ